MRRRSLVMLALTGVLGATGCNKATATTGSLAGDVELDIIASDNWSDGELASVTSLSIAVSGAQLAFSGKGYTLNRALNRKEQLVVHLKQGTTMVTLSAVAQTKDKILGAGTVQLTLLTGGATPATIYLGNSVADGFLVDDAKTTVPVTPRAVALLAGETATLQSLGAATWAMQEGAAAGTIDGSGVYTAPAVTGTYHAVATSSVFYQQSAASTISVVAHGMTPWLGRLGPAGYVDGTGAAVRLVGVPPNGFASDGKYIYFTDSGRSVVRRFDPATSSVITIAGTPIAPPDNDAVGTAATFNYPGGLVPDGQGNLYIAASDRLRKLNLASGAVTTVTGAAGYGHLDGPPATAQSSGLDALVSDGNGTLYAFEYSSCSLRSIDVASGAITTLAGTPSGSPTTYCNTFTAGTGTAARFCSPNETLAYLDGVIYLLDPCGATPAIRRFTVAGGVVDSLTTSLSVIANGLVAEGGKLYMIANSGLYTLDTASGAPTHLADFPDGMGMGAFIGNTIYLIGYATIYSYDTVAGVTTGPLAGPRSDDSIAVGPIASQNYNQYNLRGGLAVAPDGKLIASSSAKQQAFFAIDTPKGHVTPIVEGAGSFDPSQCCNTLATDGTQIYTDDHGNVVSLPVAGGTFTTLVPAAMLTQPQFYVLDGQGNLFFADQWKIRQLALATNTLTTLAGSSMPGGMDGTGAAAQFSALSGMTYDGNGNLWVTDGGAVRSVSIAGGVVTTVAGNFDLSKAACSDGVGKAARFSRPVGITIDPGKLYLYVSDNRCDAIRRVTIADGTVTTVVGTPGVGQSVIGGLPGQLASPGDLRFDAAGDLIVYGSSDGSLVQVRF